MLRPFTLALLVGIAFYPNFVKASCVSHLEQFCPEMKTAIVRATFAEFSHDSSGEIAGALFTPIEVVFGDSTTIVHSALISFAHPGEVMLPENSNASYWLLWANYQIAESIVAFDERDRLLNGQSADISLSEYLDAYTNGNCMQMLVDKGMFEPPCRSEAGYSDPPSDKMFYCSNARAKNLPLAILVLLSFALFRRIAS